MFQPLDMSPFADRDLWQLGRREKWADLRRLVAAITENNFAVVDSFSQAVVDDARRRFDTSVSDAGDNAVQKVVLGEADGDGDILKLLLAVGVHPDIANKQGWRPSHICAGFGRLEAARAIFSCRPDMTAENPNGRLPLEAASMVYNNDDEYPHRPALREDVAKFIQSEGFVTSFPTLAQLASKKQWFAVRNLIRRQVVPLSEFKCMHFGKTAEEWANHYKEAKIAAELRYYAELPTPKLLDVQKELSSKDEKVKSLEGACAEKDTKIQQLSETVAVLSSQLDNKEPGEVKRKRKKN